MKIAYVTDTHFRSTIPENRIDDFYNVQLEKLTNVMEHCKKEKIKYIFHGGDFFNTYDANSSLGLIFSIISIIKRYKVMIYSNIGSHDLKGYNMDTLNRSALGLLHNIGLVGFEKELLKNKDFKDYKIKFIPASKELTTEKYKGNYDIIVSHDPIVSQSVIYDHLMIEDISKVTKAKLVLCAHIHSPFVENKNNVLFLNPGCMVRGNVEEKDKTPQMYIVDLDSLKIRSLDIIDKDRSKNVFRKVIKKEDKIDFNEFIDSIKKIEFKSANLIKEWQMFVNTNKIDSSIKDEIMGRLENELVGT